MAKVKYIACDIYKRGIDVFIGTPQEFIKWCKNTFNEDKDDKEFCDSVETCTYGAADFHFGNGYGIVRIPKFPRTPNRISELVHELLHATDWLLWYSGIEHSKDNPVNETHTYLLEHLVRNALIYEGYETVDVKKQTVDAKSEV